MWMSFTSSLPGTVESCFHRGKEREDVVISRLEPGQFFGEVELLRGGKSIASVRASGAQVELLALPRDTFFDLLEKSPLPKKPLGKSSNAGLEENRSRQAKIERIKAE
jgi:hypothetical protein